MSLKQYLFVMIFATVLAWIGWIIVINSVNPETSGLEGITLFYVSLLLALVGTFAVLGFGLRSLTQKEELPYRLVLLSFRQSLFFSLLIVGVLMLKASQALRWWNVLLLVIVLTLMEFVALSLHRVQRKAPVGHSN